MRADEVIEARIEKRTATRGEYLALERCRRRGPRPGDQFVLAIHALQGSIIRSFRPLLKG